MSFHTIDATVSSLATRQHGVVTRQQARSLGWSNRQIETRLAAGTLTSPSKHTLVMNGAPDSFDQRMWVGYLHASSATEGLTAIADLTAGRLHRFDGMRSGQVIVGTRVRCNGTRRIDATFRYLPSLDPIDVADHDGLLVTTPVRTVLDLARILSDRRLAAVVDGLVRDRLATEADLIEALMRWRRQGRRGVTKLAAVLGLDAARLDHVLSGRPESWLERLFMELLRSWDLPRADCQRRVTDANGKIRRLDFLLDGTTIICEVEGQLGHADRASRSADAERRTALRRAGFIVLTYTYLDVTQRSLWVAGDIRRELAMQPKPAGGLLLFPPPVR
jgi:very-short-patch-repair endonuclease